MTSNSEVAAWIREGADALEVSLDGSAVAGLEAYLSLLTRWNQRVNLVGRCAPREMVDRHLHDALACLRLLDRPEIAARCSVWDDVGSGAGIPGLVLALARPKLSFRLIEPNGKKAAFLKHAVGALGLGSVAVNQARLEHLQAAQQDHQGDGEGQRSRGAMSRAVFAPSEWCRRGLAWVAPGGMVLVATATPAPALEAEARWVDHCHLPFSGAPRCNLIFEREA